MIHRPINTTDIQMLMSEILLHRNSMCTVKELLLSNDTQRQKEL